MASCTASSLHPAASTASTSERVVANGAAVTVRANANRARSRGESGAAPKSSSTARTSAGSPSSVAVVAAWACMQNGVASPFDAMAAIISRCHGESGDGPRITSCVNRFSASARAGL